MKFLKYIKRILWELIKAFVFIFVIANALFYFLAEDVRLLYSQFISSNGTFDVVVKPFGPGDEEWHLRTICYKGNYKNCLDGYIEGIEFVNGIYYIYFSSPFRSEVWRGGEEYSYPYPDLIKASDKIEMFYSSDLEKMTVEDKKIFEGILIQSEDRKLLNKKLKELRNEFEKSKLNLEK